ncbi:hypothetical protein VKS41_006312 [Umbelopsis sp. WA50703]
MLQMNEYEEKRLQNIERNRQLLQQLDIIRVKEQVYEEPPSVPAKRRVVDKPKDSIGKPKKQKLELPQRKSTRLRGLPAPEMQIETDKENHVLITGAEEPMDDDLWDGKLLSADEYFKDDIKKDAIRTDGHFGGSSFHSRLFVLVALNNVVTLTGWLSEELMKKYGFEANAADCWEKNGGGKFSYKDPLGTGKKPGKASRTSAKAIAQMMWKKNPNMYFYRHNEPSVEQWTGDWTEEEKNIFLKLAKEHGCGDKVGEV